MTFVDGKIQTWPLWLWSFNSFCAKMLFQVVISSICQFVSSFATTLSRVQYSKVELIIGVDIIITASLMVMPKPWFTVGKITIITYHSKSGTLFKSSWSTVDYSVLAGPQHVIILPSCKKVKLRDSLWSTNSTRCELKGTSDERSIFVSIWICTPQIFTFNLLFSDVFSEKKNTNEKVLQVRAQHWTQIKV